MLYLTILQDKIGGLKMGNNLQQDEQEKEVKKARIKMIIKYGLACIAWTVAAVVIIAAMIYFLFMG